MKKILNDYIVKKYIKILNKNKKNILVNPSFHYSFDELQFFKKLKIFKFNKKNKINTFKKLSNGFNYQDIVIINENSFYLKFNDISVIYVTIYKDGIMKIIYNDKDKNCNMFSLFFIKDFFIKFQNINNYCNFIFKKYLFDKSNCDVLFDKLMDNFKDIDETNNKIAFIKFLFNMYDDTNKEIVEFLDNELFNNNLNKKELLIQHLDNQFKKIYCYYLQQRS